MTNHDLSCFGSYGKTIFLLNMLSPFIVVPEDESVLFLFESEIFQTLISRKISFVSTIDHNCIVSGAVLGSHDGGFVADLG